MSARLHAIKFKVWRNINYEEIPHEIKIFDMIRFLNRRIFINTLYMVGTIKMKRMSHTQFSLQKPRNLKT